MKQFRVLKAVSVFILCTLVLACSKSSTTPAGETKDAKKSIEQIFKMGNGAEPQSLDQHITTGVPEVHIIMSISEGLVNYNPKDVSPEPGAAASWTISEDGMVYTFKMQPNGKWSNGDPVTAGDFVYSFKRALSPALGNEYAYMLYYLVNAEKYAKGEITDFSQVGVKALDDMTLEITLNSPTPYFLGVLQHHSAFPVHQKTVEKFGAIDARDNKWSRAENYVGNGAFMPYEWVVNKVLKVKRNPNYWDAKIVRLDEVHFYPIDNMLTEEKMVRSGQLHTTYELAPTKITGYQKENSKLLHIDAYLGSYYYNFNFTRAPFDNKLVRKAFAMAIDREAITKNVTRGGEIPWGALTPAGTGGYTSKAQIPYDIEKAKALLAEAGYPDGKGLPPIQLLYNTNEKHKAIAEACQQMWTKNLNVNVELVNQDWKVYLDSMSNLDFSMIRRGWIGDYVDPDAFLGLYVTDGGNNKSGFSNAEFDALIVKASKTLNNDERMALFQRAEEIYTDEAGLVPIFIYTKPYLLATEVKGWHANILGLHPAKYIYLEQ